MGYAAIFDVVYKCGLVTLLFLFSGGMVCMMYMLWKILSVIRYIEFAESTRRQFTMVPPSQSAKDSEGAFIPSTDMSNYVKEESNRVSMESGISDGEALNIIMEKIKEQRGAGNVAEV
jgi:hypothetical protein